MQDKLCYKTLTDIVYCSKKPFMEKAQEKNGVQGLIISPELCSYQFTSARKAWVINHQNFILIQKFYISEEIIRYYLEDRTYPESILKKVETDLKNIYISAYYHNIIKS